MGQEIIVNIYLGEVRGKGKKKLVAILLMGKLSLQKAISLLIVKEQVGDKSRSYSVPPQSSEAVSHHGSVWMRKTGFRLEGRFGLGARAMLQSGAAWTWELGTKGGHGVPHIHPKMPIILGFSWIGDL